MKSGEAITSESIEEYDAYPVYGGGGLRGYTSTFTHDGEFILIGRQGALCGNITYASDKFWASDHAVVVTTNAEIDTIWLGALLESMNLNQYSLSAAQPGLSVSRIKGLYVPIPPKEEQSRLANYVKQLDTETRELILQSEKQILKLQEYRQALIYEAVTGKIDVRDYNKVRA